MHQAKEQSSRKRWLFLSLVGNLGFLATFKYFNFFAESLNAAAAYRDIQLNIPLLRVALPVGISFYTFQSMSYTIDIYRRQLEPVRSPLGFLTFVAFFPQLVAGPIVRARQFLPQLETVPSLSESKGAEGLYRIGIGLMKKVVIADLLAVNLVQRVFESPEVYTSAELLFGVYGFALQIYCDFSAYSDIAIGSAMLLGLELPENFDHPYRAVNLRDFWKRWHLSLSTWLRDYLYIPLGGSREEGWRTYKNVLITMLLGGLWHGAGWTFVAWGALHGVGISATRAWQRFRAQSYPYSQEAQWSASRFVGSFIGLFFTFHFVCLAWVFFRAQTFGQAWAVLRGIAAGSAGTANITPLIWGVLALGAVTHFIPNKLITRGGELYARSPAILQACVFFAAIVGVRLAARTEIVPFVYFQF